MKKLLILLLCLPMFGYGQSVLPFSTYGTRATDTARTLNTLMLPKYATNDSNKVLGIDERGIVVLRTKGAGGEGDISLDSLVLFVRSYGDDGTAIPGRLDKPYATIDAALVACSTYTEKTIDIGYGEFGPITREYITGYTRFVGKSSGEYNNTVTVNGENSYVLTAPTKIIRGTIIKGGIDMALDVSGLEVHHIGLDNGSAFVSGGGTEANGFGMGSATTSPPFTLIRKIHLNDVKTLNSGPTSAFHGIVIENTYESIIENSSTYYAVHGIVSKGTNTIIKNNFTHEHELDGIIIKSDSYSFPRDILVEGNHIYSSNSTYGGVIFEDQWTGLSKIKFVNNTIDGTAFGIKQVGNDLDRIEIGGNAFFNITGKAIDLTNVTNTNIYNNLAPDNEIDVKGGANVTGNTASTFTLEGTSFSAPLIATGNRATNAINGYTYVSDQVYASNNFGYGKTGTSNVISDATAAADIVADDFDRADNTSTLGNTQIPGTAWTAESGTWGILNNKAYNVTNTPAGSFTTERAYVDAGVSDYTYEVDVTLLNAGGGASGSSLMFRYTDANNYLFVDMATSGIAIYKKDAGGFTQLDLDATSITAGVPITIRIVTSGTSINVYRNGVLSMSATDAFNSTATIIGFANLSGVPYGGGVYFDNLSLF